MIESIQEEDLKSWEYSKLIVTNETKYITDSNYCIIRWQINCFRGEITTN